MVVLNQKQRHQYEMDLRACLHMRASVCVCVQMGYF